MDALGGAPSDRTEYSDWFSQAFGRYVVNTTSSILPPSTRGISEVLCFHRIPQGEDIRQPVGNKPEIALTIAETQE